MEIKYKQYEEWKSIRGFKNYQISSFGRIKTLDKNVIVIRNGTKFKKFYAEKIKNPKIDGCGYFFTDLWGNGKYKYFKIHRLVLCAWTNKKYINKKQVNHKDGNKSNNNLNNLEWVTPKENIRHAEINGLRNHPKGSKCYQSKLTEKQVLKIRKEFTGEKGNLSRIAEKYKVSPATIRDVIRRVSWKHL